MAYQWLDVGPESVTLLLHLDEQTAVDRCVDALRARQVSIITLQHQRMSLEEVFLEVLGIETDEQ